MKKIQSLAKRLSRAEQKRISGGTAGSSIIYCKKVDPEVPACEVTIEGTCPASGWITICRNSASCSEYTNSASCQSSGA